MKLTDFSVRDLVGMIAKTSPELGGSTAALISSLLGIAMCKMALLVSAKRHPENDLVVTGLDSITMDITAVIDKDQACVKTLIETLNSNAETDVMRSALIDATRQPLAACHLLVEAMELLERACGEIDQSVSSDYFGGVEVIGASFRAVTMAINENLNADLLADMKSRTAAGRAELKARFERAVVSLGADQHGEPVGASSGEIMPPY